ncbi:hypothetical protein MKK84_20820 [Methylobacterium sp. E-065]|uniref:hypothetical protein n=1 Tax=Methylobacterium sp. E-065 TaxID=2836583 RepID=UPI001FB8AAA3|nr:hypothetical protein [Methylobacterium sp. E-065]MCJ2019848.1 hypothetical protein [Methylobacterium sp. E-065]
MSRALIVDNDGLIRMNGADILESAGFRTFEASDGNRATALCDRTCALIVLPFTGVQMPSSDNGFALVTGPVRFLLTLPSRCARKPPNREIPYASIPAHG